jgi:hypothetical protein
MAWKASQTARRRAGNGILSLQPIRVTRAVPALVMVEHDGPQLAWRAGVGEDVDAHPRVTPDLLPLGLRELALLLEDLRRHADLAHVVQASRDGDLLDVVEREAHLACETLRHGATLSL